MFYVTILHILYVLKKKFLYEKYNCNYDFYVDKCRKYVFFYCNKFIDIYCALSLFKFISGILKYQLLKKMLLIIHIEAKFN